MTCTEKLKLEHPDTYENDLDTLRPDVFGYAAPPDLEYCEHSRCSECWDREVLHYEDKITFEPVIELSKKSLVDEICEARKKLTDAGFSANEAFNLVWDMFKGRWEQ